MPKRGLPRSPNGNLNHDAVPTGEGVSEPDVNDVISGRGDTINRHPGNVQFRKLVEEKRRVYLSSHFKREKRLIAETIVATIKAMDPPGRFLSRDPRTGLWFSIGEDRAREKASQALRENSKKIRAEIQQTDLLRKRENTPSSSGGHSHRHQGSHHGHGHMEYNPASGKPGHYDPHHYPYAPSGPGWGYPYYYGYGSHQVPPFPPTVFHPHPYPLPPHHLPPGPIYGAAYPEVVPYGSSRQDFDQPHSMPSYNNGLKSMPEDRLQHSENDDDHHMDSSISSQREEPQPQQEQHEQTQQSRADRLKCRRIEPLNEQAGEHHNTANANTDSRDHQPKELRVVPQPFFYPPKEPQSHPRHRRSTHGFGHPPVMPTLNATSTQGSGSTIQVERTPQKAAGSSSSGVQASTRTPETTVHKLALTHATSPPSCYAIKSPHNHNYGHPRGPFDNHSATNHPGATLTPAGASCMAALSQILGSPGRGADQDEGSSNASMYHDSPTASSVNVTINTMDSPLASPKDPAVPFSPIRAHLDAKGRPNLKPRPFYR